jgi:hypothetical protein
VPPLLVTSGDVRAQSNRPASEHPSSATERAPRRQQPVPSRSLEQLEPLPRRRDVTLPAAAHSPAPRCGSGRQTAAERGGTKRARLGRMSRLFIVRSPNGGAARREDKPYLGFRRGVPLPRWIGRREVAHVSRAQRRVRGWSGNGTPKAASPVLIVSTANTVCSLDLGFRLHLKRRRRPSKGMAPSVAAGRQPQKAYFRAILCDLQVLRHLHRSFLFLFC